jgi:hypothetical protein
MVAALTAHSTCAFRIPADENLEHRCAKVLDALNSQFFKRDVEHTLLLMLTWKSLILRDVRLS